MTYPEHPPRHVRLPSCGVLPQPQRLTGARQIHRFSARHSECAIPAIGLALYVPFSKVRFLLSRLLIIIISEGVLAPHQVVVARAPCAHTHALLVSYEQKRRAQVPRRPRAHRSESARPHFSDQSLGGWVVVTLPFLFTLLAHFSAFFFGRPR